MAPNFDQLDASENAFFSRQLEYIRPRTYDIKYKQLKARMFIPVDGSAGPGAEVITYRQFTMYGLAKFIANYASDFPRADVSGLEFTSKIRSLGASYGYSVQDIRAAIQAGTDLQQRKANAARRAIEEAIDTTGKTGSSVNGMLGLLNQTSTTSYTVPNGAAGSPLWTRKTADEIVSDMHGIANGIVSSTKEVETPDTLILPIAQYTLAATKRMGDGSDVTCLAYFLKTSPYIKSVEMWEALTGAGVGPTDRMVCYRKDPDALMFIIPQEFEQFAPQQKGMEFVVPCHARVGGVVMFYPLSMSYGDGI